jgi:hypothetical protein
MRMAGGGGEFQENLHIAAHEWLCLGEAVGVL